MTSPIAAQADLSSAVGEMASKLGCDVELTQCPFEIPWTCPVGNLALRSTGTHGACGLAGKYRSSAKFM